jgi:hypothetical protein
MKTEKKYKIIQEKKASSGKMREVCFMQVDENLL